MAARAQSAGTTAAQSPLHSALELPMKIAAILLIWILPATSMALSLVNPCTKDWPKDTPAGKIQMKYRISEKCEPEDVRFLISEPDGAFNDFAMCHIKRVIPYWDPSETMETITIEEYERRIEENRAAAPDRYHYREIHAMDNAGERIKVTCYFNKDWAVTGHAVGDGKTEKPVTEDFIRSLPEQNFESTFESEL